MVSGFIPIKPESIITAKYTTIESDMAVFILGEARAITDPAKNSNKVNNNSAKIKMNNVEGWGMGIEITVETKQVKIAMAIRSIRVLARIL